MPLPGEGRELPVAVALADARRFLERGVGGRGVVLEEGADAGGEEQVALLHALAAGVGEQPLSAREPATAPGQARRSAAACTASQ